MLGGTENPNNDLVVPSCPNDGVSSISWSPKANIFVATSWDNQVHSPRFNSFIFPRIYLGPRGTTVININLTRCDAGKSLVAAFSPRCRCRTRSPCCVLHGARTVCAYSLVAATTWPSAGPYRPDRPPTSARYARRI